MNLQLLLLFVSNSLDLPNGRLETMTEMTKDILRMPAHSRTQGKFLRYHKSCLAIADSQL